MDLNQADALDLTVRVLRVQSKPMLESGVGKEQDWAQCRVKGFLSPYPVFSPANPMGL